MPNIFLIAFFAFLLTGIFLLSNGFKQYDFLRLTALFFLIGAASLAYYFFSVANTLQNACVWLRVGTIAIFLFLAAYSYFILILTKIKLRKKYLIFGGLPMLVLLIFISLNVFNHIGVEDNEQGLKTISRFVLAAIYAGVVLFYFAANAVLLFFWRKRAALKRHRFMANIILISLFLTVLFLTVEFLIVKNRIFGNQPLVNVFSGTILLAPLFYCLRFLNKGEVLAETEQLILFSLSTDLVFVIDTTGIVTKLNYSVVKNLGLSTEEIILKPFANLIRESEKERFYKLLSNKQAWEQEFTCLNVTNEKIPLNIRCNPVLDKYGDLAEFILVGCDKRLDVKIKQETGLNRELQYELLKAKEKASESDKLKSAFLSVVTHELRTPLNGILGFTELLRTELVGSEQFEIVDYIDKSGKRLLGTINSIIDLSLIETNKNEINKQPVNLKTLIQQKSNPYIPYAQSKNLFLDIQILNDKLMARTDERMLGHILSNLLDNAVKYTETGGITISLEVVKSNNRVKALIKVADTGIGIDKKDFSRIFEKFRQGSEGYNRAYEGMGIGLSICKTFVDLLDGELWLESETGKGSVFYLQLPAYLWNEATENAAVVEEDFTNLQGPGFRPCALIVEDNHSNRAFMKYLLLEYYEVDDTVSGVSALGLAQKNQYDMIFISLNPETQNIEIEAMKNIKALPGYQNVPVAAITTNIKKSEQEDLLLQGFSHHVSKPYTREILLAVAAEMLVAGNEESF